MYIVDKILKIKRIYKTILIYLILGSLWILFSDRLVYSLISNKENLSKVQTYKGWFFILVTAYVLFVVLKYYFKKIIQNERRMNKLLDNSPDIVVQLDRNLNYLYVNEKIVEVFGKKKKELIGNDIRIFNFPDELVKKRNKNINEVFETGKETKYEITYPVKKEKRVYDVRIVPQYEDDWVTSVLYIGRDITERKYKEERIKQLNKILITVRNINQLISSTNDVDKLANEACYLLVNVRGFLFSVIGVYNKENKNLDKLYFSRNISLENDIEKKFRKKCFELIDQFTLHKDVNIIRDIPENCRELFLFNKNGKLVISKLKYKNRIFGFLIVKVEADFLIDDYEKDLFKEISADIAFAIYRIRMEKKLEEVEFKYKNLFNSMIHGIAVHGIEKDKKGNLTIKYIDVNKKYLEIIDKRKSEVIDESLSDIMPECHKTYTYLEDDLMQKDKNVYFDMYAPSLDKYLQIYLYKLDKNKFVCVVFDKTKEVESIKREMKIECKLQQKQKLETLGTLASGIAHDFNNIIFAISGNLRLMMDKMDNKRDAFEHLKNALKAVNRAENLVKQILTFSKNSEEEFEPVYVQDEIEEVLNLTRSSFPKSIKIESSIDSNCPPVYANGTHLHQVFMNIITNSFQAMKDKGTLSISLEQNDINEGLLLDKKSLKINIRDSGAGMDEETKQYIFDPFFTTKDKHEGTGLGLSVVKNIIDKLDGKIEVESEPGKGTEFIISLPVMEEKRVGNGREKNHKNISIAGLKIMFVDDEEMIADLMKESLETEDIIIDIFTKPYNALRKFKDNPDYYDLVITDLTMPKISGLELAEKIKEVKCIPVILSTGSLDSTLEKKAKNININSLIKKPFDFNELLKTINKLI